MESIEKHKEQISIWRLCFMVSQGRKYKKRWFGPSKVQYCLPNNTINFVFINNIEPNLVLVNVNKLKPYKYVDQTLKVI